MSIDAEREMWGEIARNDRPRPTGRATKTIANRRPDACSLCGAMVPAGGGIAELRGRTWSVRHRPPVWSGSPVSGGWTGGCPS